jgi:soluble lytic murein transglycosylase-like protein
MGCSKQLTVEEVVSLARKYGAKDPLLVAAIAKVESNFCVDAVGPADECGIMQTRVPTAQWVTGQPISCEELFNPNKSIAVGVRYLNYLIDSYGLPDAISAYHAGSPRPGSSYERKVVSEYIALGGRADWATNQGTPTQPTNPKSPSTGLDPIARYALLFAGVLLGTVLIGTAITGDRD